MYSLKNQAAHPIGCAALISVAVGSPAEAFDSPQPLPYRSRELLRVLPADAALLPSRVLRTPRLLSVDAFSVFDRKMYEDFLNSSQKRVET